MSRNGQYLEADVPDDRSAQVLSDNIRRRMRVVRGAQCP